MPILLFLLILLPSQARASTTGADYLRVDVPARAAGMGGAYAAAWDDSTAFLWNPAALARVPESGLSATHFQSVLDTAYEQALLAQPGRPWLPGGWGLEVQYSSTRNFNETDDQGNDKGQVENFDTVVQAGYGLPVTDRLFIGAAFKVLNSRLGEYRNHGQAVDLGVQSQITDNVGMGLSLLNWGQQSAYDQVADPLPTTLKLACQGVLLDRPEARVLAAAEVDRPWNSDDPLLFRIGSEYWYLGRLAFRAGYVFGTDLGNLSIGLGLHLFGLGLDYAYVPFNELGFTHRISMSVSLGGVAKALGAAGETPLPKPVGADRAVAPMPAPAGMARPLTRGAEATRATGTLARGTVWRLADSPVLVSGDLVIPRGLSLDIEPGVEVRFHRREVAARATVASLPEAGEARLVVLGRLGAVGTATAPVVFAGERGPQWGALVFENGADPAGRLEYCRVEGGRVVVNASAPVITHCQFNGSPLELGSQASPEVFYCVLQDAESGISTWSASSSLSGIHHNLITRNRYGIYIKDVGPAVLRQNTFVGNLAFDILNSSPKAVDAARNFWGTQDLEAVEKRVFDARAASASGPVTLTPTAK